MEQNRVHTVAAPARVNLIGEHTDYTGGLVLPIAIPFTTEAAIALTDDGLYHLRSDLFGTEHTLTPEDRSGAAHDWSDYPVGVLRELQLLGHQPPPFVLRLSGNVPLASGLSSSASVEVATAFALLDLLQVDMRPEDIALLCQRAENNFVGSPCGIMDQTVVTLAEADHALLLNTRDLHHESVPMNLGAMADTALVVCNSGVMHSIATGEYGQRRREVEQGQAALLQAQPQLRDLGDATLAALEAVRDRMSPESFRRCRHIITENARVRAMQEALLSGDPQTAGELMLTAHASQRDDFACSCEEIDFLVDTAARLPGCFGARMTGGGFGGCTVNLVRNEAAEAFQESLREAYQARYHIHAQIFACKAVDGALRRYQHSHPATASEVQA